MSGLGMCACVCVRAGMWVRVGKLPGLRCRPPFVAVSASTPRTCALSLYQGALPSVLLDTCRVVEWNLVAISSSFPYSLSLYCLPAEQRRAVEAGWRVRALPAPAPEGTEYKRSSDMAGEARSGSSSQKKREKSKPNPTPTPTLNLCCGSDLDHLAKQLGITQERVHLVWVRLPSPLRSSVLSVTGTGKQTDRQSKSKRDRARGEKVRHEP